MEMEAPFDGLLSVAMLTRYDVTRSGWSSHFLVKVHVFSTSFHNKSKSEG